MNGEEYHSPQAEISEIDKTLAFLDETLAIAQRSVGLLERLLERNEQIIKEFGEKENNGELNAGDTGFLSNQRSMRETYIARLLQARRILTEVEEGQQKRREELMELREKKMLSIQ